MNTFLPYPSFEETARVLDRRRLGKQRIEALEILRIIENPSSRSMWRWHPAVLMWDGFSPLLAAYGLVTCEEWKQRGYRDNLMSEIYQIVTPGTTSLSPWWLGDDRLHESHKSNLLRKAPEHYRRYWPDLRDDLPYWWPVKMKREQQ